MDQLSFETLISTSLLAGYMSVLMQYRRIVVCGPSGTGKTHLALALAQSLVHRCEFVYLLATLKSLVGCVAQW